MLSYLHIFKELAFLIHMQMNNNNNYNDENRALCIITIKMINKNILPFKSQKWVRAVPFKSVGGRRNGRFFEGGEGPNSELVYTIRVYMISGRRGRGVSNF